MESTSSQSALPRLLQLQKHLVSAKDTSQSPTETLAYYRSKSTVNAPVLRDLVYGKFLATRESIFRMISREPIFKHHTTLELDRKEARYLAFKQMKKIIKNFPEFMSYEEYMKDPTILTVVGDLLWAFDQSVSVKIGVHYQLYTKTLMNLGTAKHRKLQEDAIFFRDTGCFGLTELGHGSNVRDIRTTATYDPKTREFIINTPDDLAMKFFIGAAAHLANISVIFAQLYVNGKCHGVHAFVVPIRNKTDHSVLSGVIIGDCGPKVGLSGVDNGFMLFNNVRIPYDNLLDRFSSISPEHEFKSTIKNDDKRFGISLGSLSNGRISLVSQSNAVLRNALTIGIRYASTRRQFGNSGEPEKSIIEYPLVQYRLMPYLAGTFAYGFASSHLSNLWISNQEIIFDEKNPLLKEIHALSSVLKPIVAWFTQKGIQEVREICGGLGYSAYNRIGAYREENDVNGTWEGDNNVLLQQGQKFVLSGMKKLMKNTKNPYETLYYLKADFDPEAFKWSVKESNQCLQLDCLLEALEFKGNYTAFRATSKLQENFGKADEMAEVWNLTQPFYLTEVPKSYCDIFVFNQFRAQLKKCSDKPTKRVLEKLCQLWALYRIEQDYSVYNEVKFISREQIEWVRDLITELCSILKDEANGLVDAFTLNDDILGSPIGAYDGDIYNRFLGLIRTLPGTFEKPSYWREIFHKKN